MYFVISRQEEADSKERVEHNENSFTASVNNPFALKVVKTQLSFGHSECKRVKVIIRVTYIFGVGTNIVGCLGIISTFCQPFLYHITVSWSMVLYTTPKTEMKRGTMKLL